MFDYIPMICYNDRAETNHGAFCFTPAGQPSHIIRYGQSAPYVSDVPRPAVRLSNDRQTFRGRFVMSSKLTEEDRAYLAGLIDGEGCIFISKARQSGKKRHLAIYRLLVVVSQANQSHLQFWRDKTGLGNVLWCASPKKTIVSYCLRHEKAWGKKDGE